MSSSNARESGSGSGASGSSKYAGPQGLVPNDFKTGPKGEPMTPIPSATLVILCPTRGRDGKTTEYATLAVQRSNRQGGSFRSAVVFPGGLLDQADEYAVKQQDQPRSGKEANTFDEEGQYLQSLQLCALRETFEETGLLLVPAAFEGKRYSRAIGHVEAGMSSQEWSSMRKEVHDDARAFVPFLARIQAVIQGNSVQSQLQGSQATRATPLPPLAPLSHYSHWITPRNMCRPAKRFDTHFFVTILDEADALGPLSSAAKQGTGASSAATTSTGAASAGRDVSSISADGSETTSVRLATPAELMHLAVRDDIVLFPPQYYILSDIAIALDAHKERPNGQLTITPLRFGTTAEAAADALPVLSSDIPARPHFDTVTGSEPMIQPQGAAMVPRTRLSLAHRGEADDDAIGVFVLALPGDTYRPLRAEDNDDASKIAASIRFNRVYVTPRTKGEGGGLMVHGARRQGMPGLRDFQYGTHLPELDQSVSQDDEPLTSKL